MAEIRRQTFQTVKVDIEEMDRKIKRTQDSVLKRARHRIRNPDIALVFAIYISSGADL